MFFSVYFSAKLDNSAIIAPKAKIELADAYGNIIENGRMYKYIPYQDISPNVINAFIALEDKRFYSHNGVDYYRLAGALIQDIKTASFKEGGSTITQQLAKNTQLSSEKTIKRKIKELRLARLIEKQYSKEQILEMYLNAIYFGSGIYGIDSASKNYFGKSASELSAAEGAILAGIVKNPARYSPKSNLSASTERRNLVLKLMYEQNYIDESTYNNSKSDKYVIPENVFNGQICTPYYNNVLAEAAEILVITEKTLISSDYKIYTYYSPANQSALHSSITSDEYSSVNSYGSKAAISAMIADNDTGGISAYYGSDDCDIFSFRRQPGSAIKPILVYAPAIEYGIISSQTPLLDEKIEINGYSPKNYGDTYSGWITAETALAKSINTVAVKLFEDTGKKQCFSFAQKCGLRFSPSDSTAASLGGLTDGLTFPELSSAYMTLANGGIYKKNTFIKKIIDPNGNLVYEHKKQTSRAMSADTAFLITQMLEKTVKEGTASKLNGFNYAIASKTGTTQSVRNSNNLDAWNISYTTEHTLTVWYGDTANTKETSIETTGSGYPSLLARKIYSLLPSPNLKQFEIPETVYKLEIDNFALQKDHILYLSNNFTPDIYRKESYFSLKNCPTASSPYFDITNIKFSLRNTNDTHIIEIAADEPYTFTLEEYNLLSGDKAQYEFSSAGIHTIPSHEYPNGIYSYRLCVKFNNSPLGYVYPNKPDYFNIYSDKLRLPTEHFRQEHPRQVSFQSFQQFL